MNDGSWYLEIVAIIREFKMTLEQVVEFLNSSHGKAVDNFLLFYQFGTSKTAQVYSLDDLRRVMGVEMK